jgi:hypothetical protein
LLAPGSPGGSFPRLRGGVTFFARAPRCRSSAERRSRPAGWRTGMCAIKKVTKETRRRPRAVVLRTSVPCAPRSVEGRCGNSLRSDTRTSPPSPDLRCSARYKADWKIKINGKSIHAWRGSTGAAVAFDLESALSEPSIAGESGAKRRRCLSAASSAPSPDSPRSAGYRRVATARGWRSVSLVTFFARKESDNPPRSRKRISGRTNENGTFAGAVSMNRFTRKFRISRRTRQRSRC